MAPSTTDALDATPRWMRVTYLDEHRKRRRFTGLITFDGDIVRGARKDSTQAAPDDITLSLFYADPDDVVKVERQDPRYETWVTA